ncbi:MAG: septum site-determining protein MinC [Pyramidobacter sp.]|nr:septum site-determining protein MinC [Pyramidobacter sp.]
MVMSERKRELSFKGRGSSLYVAFEGASLPGTPDVLRELRDAGALIKGHPLIFDFKDLPVSRVWFLDFMRDAVFPLQLSITQWCAANPQTRDTLASLGLKLDGAERPIITQGTLKILKTPLRSGQSVHHDGDVLLIGNLHSGADISATGSIVVLGALKGRVHAGCSGDNQASVITMCYMTNQLRIGTMVSNIMEPDACPWWGKPAHISVEDGVFIAGEILREK